MDLTEIEWKKIRSCDICEKTESNRILAKRTGDQEQLIQDRTERINDLAE